MEENRITCLGVGSSDAIFLLSRQGSSSGKQFRIDKSSNGKTFKKYTETNFVFDNLAKGSILQDFRLSRVEKDWVLVIRLIHQGTSQLGVLKSTDLEKWKLAGWYKKIQHAATVVGDYKHKGNYVLYTGGKSLRLHYSEDLVDWFGPYPAREKGDKKPLIIIGNASLVENGILVTYFASANFGQITNYSVQAMLFDKNDPEKALWKRPKTIAAGAGAKLPIGTILFEGNVISYWQMWGGELLALEHGSVDKIFAKDYKPQKHPRLTRHHKNPLLTPNKDHFWQSEAVFNPAAIYDEGTIHLLYRAVGDTNTSVWGHAKSHDGVNFDTHHEPVYTPRTNHEGQHLPPTKSTKYVSGPGWGGCEDPRAVVIDGKLYVTYVAFNGYEPARVALTSISMDDFRQSNWNWSMPVMISKRHWRPQKNWMLFPEKINGKYAIIHSIFPEILIDYLDDIDSDQIRIASDRLDAHKPNIDRWDTRLRGAGPPPIKTKDGWLLFYHAMDINEPSKYKVGAMLLDLQDPTKILHRSTAPVLEPTTHYENGGLKPGVIFASGAVVFNDKIHVYYGGADNTVSVAYFLFDKFIDRLKHNAPIKSSQLEFNQLKYD